MEMFSVLNTTLGKAWGLYTTLDEARGALPQVLAEGDRYQIDRMDTRAIGVTTLVEGGTYQPGGAAAYSPGMDSVNVTK